MAASKRRLQDAYGQRARKDGYPARSVYKLEEIDRRVRLLRRGMRVLDLGASPGSWTQYAAKRVGAEGRVLGIDIQEPQANLPTQATIEVADVWSLDVATLGGPFDVVLSDMAPKTSGQRHADQYRSYELFMRALEIAEEALCVGGSFVGKIFQGAEFDDAKMAVQKRFEKRRIIRPKATRDVSYELFLVGLGYLPDAD